MLPELDTSFVLNNLQNPNAYDGVGLDLLLHNNDTPLLNIDPEQTLDPTPNDPQQSISYSPSSYKQSEQSCFSSKYSGTL